MKLIFKFSLFLFSISNSLILYSQVTITEIEKIDEKIVLKPEPYDSMENWKYFELYSDYRSIYGKIGAPLPESKIYIGLKIYLPPFENPKIGCSGNEYKPFLISSKPSIFNIDTTIKPLKIKKEIYSGS